MVAALWRESATATLAEGERAATMAALLHRDVRRRRSRPRAIAASGLEPRAWVRRYLRCYLRPLVHALLAHDLAFMPHGENLILVLEDHVPVRALVMKDIGEEVALMRDRPLPADVERARLSATDDVKALGIFTDVFDGVLRGTCRRSSRPTACCPRRPSGALVESCIDEHPHDHPHLREQRGPVRTALRALLPEPTSAAQHAADGRPHRPGRRP